MFLRPINRTIIQPYFSRLISSSAREYKVILDNNTLYVDQSLAEALGWKPGLPPSGVNLTLSGWEPHYFAIAQTGTDSGMSYSLSHQVQRLVAC